MSCRFLLPALGILSAVNFPNIPNAEAFRGTMVHTALWPKEEPVLAGKRVAVIGTGSSGVQLITHVAPEVSHLYVFQRTPNWVLPLNNKPISEERAEELRSKYADIYKRLLAAPNGYIHTESMQKGGDLTEEQRREFFEELWQAAGLRFFSGNFKDLITNKAVNDSLNRYLSEKIRARIKDPKLAERLVPTDHGFGTKRPPLDSGYFEVFERDNVTLIDARNERIQQICETGIVTDKSQYDVDVIVIATGFDALTGAFERVDIRGLKGENSRSTGRRAREPTSACSATAFLTCSW